MELELEEVAIQETAKACLLLESDHTDVTNVEEATDTHVPCLTTRNHTRQGSLGA